MQLKSQTVLLGTQTGPNSLSGSFIINASTTATFVSGYTFVSPTTLTLGNYSTLNWNQNAILGGTAITAGTAAGYYATINVGTGNSLTLDSATTLTGDVYLYGNTGATIINQGTISQTSGTGYIYGATGQTFTNQGAITASGGSSLNIGYYYTGQTVTNASGGTITSDGAGTNIYLQNIVNQGTLTAQNGGVLEFQGGSNTTANLGNVVIGSGGGHAYLQGIFDNTSATLNAPTGGAYELYGGTINNGTIAAGALSFTGSGGTLSNVSYTGNLNLGASTSVTLTNGTAFTGTNLSLGNYSTLYWNQNGTLAGKTITAGTTAGAYGEINVGTGNSLTLDSATTLTGDVYLYGNTGATITNQGTIAQTSGTGYIYGSSGPTIINQGAITATGASSLYVGYYYTGQTVTNASGGTITSDGAGTNIYLSNIANQGTLTAQNGGVLEFQGGSNTTANLGSVVIGSGGGHAYLNGTFDNTSGLATLAAPTGGSYELYGGTINGGTIAPGALSFTSSGGTLNNVSYSGNLTLPASTSLTFTGGTTFTGISAALGNYSTLYWNQNGTLAGKAITAGTSAGAYGLINVGTNNTLTLDSATTLTGDTYLYGNTGSTITNQGVIAQTSGTGYVYGPTIINQGAITVGSGSSLNLGYYSTYATTNTATGSITLTGGTVYVNAPLANAGVINVQSGTLNAGGYLTNGSTGILEGFGTISGNLSLAAGKLATGASIGTLTFANGSFAVTGPSTLAVQIGGISSDKFVFQNPTSTVDLGSGLLNLSITLLSTPTPTSNYTIMSIAGGVNTFAGRFAGLPNSGDSLIATFGSNQYTLTVNYLPTAITLSIPEPSTYALMGAGLALLVFRRHYARR